MARQYKKYSDNEFYITLHEKVVALAPLEIGHYAPDIGLPDTRGNEVKISSTQGKYTILYFWASDNQNSTAENKNISKLYSKYKNKGLQLYSISLDADKDKWIKALNQYDLEGIEVCDLQGYHSVGAQVYMIGDLPMVYILDPSGKIIDKGLTGASLDARIAKLFNK